MIKFKTVDDNQIWINPTRIVAVKEEDVPGIPLQIGDGGSGFVTDEHIDSVLNRIRNAQRPPGSEDAIPG